MDLRSYVLELLAPLGLGDELLPGVVITGVSVELGPRVTLQRGAEEVHVEVEPLTSDRPNAARSARLMFSYRSGSGELRVDPELGLALCQALARLASKNEADMLRRISVDARRMRESDEQGTKIRELNVDRLLESAGTPQRRYYTLSPYVGCLIGCKFCYAQSRVSVGRRLEQLPETRWGSWVDVRINAAEVLARELEQLPPKPIKFCPIVSDPYQAVEKRYELTRQCLSVLRDTSHPRPTMVLTRSRMLERDVDVLSAIPDARAGVSIPTADDAVRKHFEPRGSSVPERLGLLDTLRNAGVGTFAVVQPILPGSLEALADALAQRVQSVSVDVLHGVQGAEQEFSATMYAEARDSDWQLARAKQLKALLERRQVNVWHGELPPDL